jgi:hypothetical protein
MSRSAASVATHICFYSNRCEWSKAFITELAQTPYRAEFRFVCVDPGPTRPQLPSWLKKVPTLVISGEPEPRTDNEVMNWLYERRLKDGSHGGGAAAGGAGAAAAGAEPEPYMDSEMGGGYGDSYSFLDMDTSTGGNGGMRMAHNFELLGGGGAAVSTKDASSFQTTDMSGKKSRKEEMLDKQMEAYMKARDTGVPKGPARM